METYKAGMEEYQKPEVQAQVKESRDMQNRAKKQLHKVVDSEKYDDNDKELLHAQIDEMTEDGFSTTIDILSRYSGRIQGMKFDPKSKVMSVNMKYSPEGQVTDSLFGDKVAGRQFKKFVEDLKGEPIQGKQGQTSLGKPPSVQLNIEGSEEDTETTAITEAMKKFSKETVRLTFNRARAAQNADEALAALEKDKDKFSDEEWNKVETMFKGTQGDMDAVRRGLRGFPLLASETAYLEDNKETIAHKIAATVLQGIRMKESAERLIWNSEGETNMNIKKMLMASVATMGVYRRFAQLSDEEKQEVVDKVKEKMNLKDDSGSPERGAKTNSSGRRTRETSHRIPQNLRDHMDDVRGQHLARFLSPDLIVMREINSDETEKAVETIDTTVNGLVVDRSVDQRLLDRLVMKGLEYVAARDFKGIIKRPLNIRLLRIGS